MSCSIGQCAELIHSAIVDGSVTGELLDRYEVRSPDGLKCLVMVYEKHYWRAGNRLTLTVTIDNMSGRARVHTVGGGGGEGQAPDPPDGDRRGPGAGVRIRGGVH